MKRILLVIAGMLFIGGNLCFAGGDLVVDGGASIGGDLIVDGKVGIGTATPTSSLHVNATSGTGVYSTTSGTGSIGVHGNGDIGVQGTTSGINSIAVYATAPTSYSTGVKAFGSEYDFYAAGPGVDYGTASSVRWKRNIRDIDNALDKVLKIRGVYFDWDKEHGEKHDMGFIAEEIGKQIPEIVAYEEDGVNATGVDYGAMTPLLVQAVKEQQKMIDDQKALVQEQQKEITDLKAQQKAMAEQQAMISVLLEKVSALEKQVQMQGTVALTTR